MSFIAIALLLIKGEPRKYTNIDLIKGKLIFVLTFEITVDFGKSLLIANNSLSFETKILRYISIAPCILNVSGVKLACSTSKILLL